MDIALLVIRVILGLAIARHGAEKLFGWFGGYGIAGTAGFFEQLGWRPGRLFVLAAAGAELGGGLLTVLGLGGPIGLALIVGGALSNMLDRARIGSVIDFVHVYYKAWSFAVFNFADAAITIGVIAILVSTYLEAPKSCSES